MVTHAAMDRNRKWRVGLRAVLLIVLSQVTSSLDVPLDLPQPPTITQQSPKDYIFDPRENIVIHCEAKGKPNPSFSWTRNGSHFDVEKDSKVLMKPGSGTLVIDISGEAAEAYEGTYQCTAHNQHGTAVSNKIVIRQSRSPLWAKERNEAIRVHVGVSLMLQCRPPAGLPPPVVFWMDKNFQKLPLDKRVSQALNGDLYFSHVIPEDSRLDYICYARFPHTQTIQQKQPISVAVLEVETINETLAALYNITGFWAGRTFERCGRLGVAPYREPLCCYSDQPTPLRELPLDLLFSAYMSPDSPEGEHRPGFMMPLGSNSTEMVLRGETLELECIAEGLPTPDISWQKEGGELPHSRMSLQNFQKTLKISDVTEADAGEYRCTASNKLGNAHHVIAVTVKAAPFWVSAPRNLILAPNETGILTCRVGGEPKPTIAWSVNGIPIENAPEDNNRRVDDDTVIFDNVQSGSSAVYQCNATNEFGYLLANAFVSVLAQPPRVLTPPDRVYQVLTNKPALLHCASFGSPIPTITWYKDSQTSITNADPYVIHENGTLEILVAQPLNSGKYTCIATNNLGLKENHVFLEVKEPTRILTPLEYKSVLTGKNVSFECKVKHDPSLVPAMTWLKNGEKFPDDERFVIGIDSLTIKDVTPEDDGSYTCVMTTALDQDSAFAMLKVIEATPTPAVAYEKPDPPTDLKLTDQKERSVRLTWTPGYDGNSPTYKFLIQYEDLLHQPGVWNNLTEVDGDHTTAHLDLSPYTYYSFRIHALNTAGIGEPSQPSSQYRTSPAAPDDNPSDAKAIGTEPGVLNVSWTPLTGFQSNGPSLEYKVQWRQKDVAEDWSSKNVVNVSHLLVSGTEAYVPYEVKVQAFNDYGNGPEPEVVTGYSGEDLPLSSPEDVRLVVDNRQTEVHWKAVSSDSVRGKLLGYKVYYWRERGFLEADEEAKPEEQFLTFSGNLEKGRLPDLQNYSLYSLVVRVFNSKGEGPDSERKTFETPEGVPGQPSFLHVIKPTLDSLTLEWGPPTKPNGRLTGYTMKYHPINSTHELAPPKTMNFLPNETTFTVGNLNSSVLYKFYLCGQTIKGDGDVISREAFTVVETIRSQPTVEAGKGLTEPPHPTSPITQSPPPPSHNAPPLGPAFGTVNTSVTEDGAVISWDYFGPHKNVYVEYVVENSKEEWKKELANSSHWHMIKGLKPGTSYRVRVVARDPADPTVHSTDEMLVAVPAAASRQVDIATQGWFIGLMCAIALLILVLLIVCFIKRNKGGKYPVKEKEDAHQDPEIQPMKEDDGTFGEYSDTEDHKPLKGSRTPSNGTVRRDESDDSLVDYGEGGDGQFNEDGSFIGQYSGKKEKDTHEGNESSEAPSPVNAMNSFV